MKRTFHSFEAVPVYVHDENPDDILAVQAVENAQHCQQGSKEVEISGSS
jgi:hypothetical protein